MSWPRDETLSCPKCGNQQRFRAWGSVNVSADPELKPPLLDGSLTTFLCQQCGQATHVPYDLLYHDMTRCLAIWLIYPGPPERLAALPEIAKMFESFSRRYILRLVSSFPELLEKIRIFDEGWDDLTVELVKLFVSITEGFDLSSPLYYAHKERSILQGDSIILGRIEDNGQCSGLKYPLAQSLETLPPVVERLRMVPSLAQGGWVHLDRNFVSDLIKEAALTDLCPES